jgi:hypothetical protein
VNVSRQIRFAWFAVAVALLSLATPAARADVKLDVALGWETRWRPGEWTPIFVTLSDTAPRAVVIQVDTGELRESAMQVRTAATIGPRPATYMLYTVVGYRSDLVHVTVSDARTGKLLADLSPTDQTNFMPSVIYRNNQRLLGISGEGSSTLRSLESMRRTEDGELFVGTVPQRLLPDAPVGYAGLDALILNRPNFNTMPADVQAAIAAWVRAGGRLLVWPGESAWPASSPLVDLMPARASEATVIELNEATLKKLGLPDRFARLPARQLTPVDGARTITPVGAELPAYVRDAGMGRVVLVAFDPAQMQFADSDKQREFWNPLLDPLWANRSPIVVDEANSRFSSNPNEDPGWLAYNGILNWIGDVPGAGSFGFQYVAVAVGALLLLVGPIDWFVLRRLKRQPWTWVSTGAWIALFTLAAVYAGELAYSGDTHFRTVTLIEQAGGRVVAKQHIAGMYAPRTTFYAVNGPAGPAWWQPVAAKDPSGFMGGSNLSGAIDVDQLADGNRLAPQRVPIWSLRFWQSTQYADEGPVIEASLTTDAAGKLAGTVTNRGDKPIRVIGLFTENAVWAAPQGVDGTMKPGVEVAPGKSEAVPTLLPSAAPAAADPQGRFVAPPTAEVTVAQLRLLPVLGRYPVAVDAGSALVIAEVVDPQAALSLDRGGALTANRTLIRAVVPVGKSQGGAR